jgi:hypothetical protein
MVLHGSYVIDCAKARFETVSTRSYAKLPSDYAVAAECRPCYAREWRAVHHPSGTLFQHEQEQDVLQPVLPAQQGNASTHVQVV